MRGKLRDICEIERFDRLNFTYLTCFSGPGVAYVLRTELMTGPDVTLSLNTNLEQTMKVRRAKIISIAILTVPLALTAFLNAPPTGAAAVADDAATIYKAKCAMCHGPAAAKAFDPAKPDEDLVKAILKGQP